MPVRLGVACLNVSFGSLSAKIANRPEADVLQFQSTGNPWTALQCWRSAMAGARSRRAGVPWRREGLKPIPPALPVITILFREYPYSPGPHAEPSAQGFEQAPEIRRIMEQARRGAPDPLGRIPRQVEEVGTDIRNSRSSGFQPQRAALCDGTKRAIGVG